MKKISTCSTCGHTKTIHRHHLNQPMVSALRQLVDFYEDNKMPCNLQKYLKLTKNQYNNFQKLQYFELVVRRPNEGWYPRERGFSFIYGTIAIYDSAASIDNVPIAPDHPYWNDVQKKPQKKYVYEIDRTSYKQREEYQKEKAQQLTLYPSL